MDYITRRKFSKILYYRYFDLHQFSLFLNDKQMIEHSKSMMDYVSKYIKSGALFSDSTSEVKVPEIIKKDIDELIATKNIASIQQYKKQVPIWLHQFISPQYLDLSMLQIFVRYNNFNDAKDVHQYLNHKSVLTEFEQRVWHLLWYSNADTYPSKYAIQYNLTDKIETNYQDSPIFGTLHNHTSYSDGACSIDDMINEAQHIGYHYIGISDHSKSTLLGMEERDLLIQYEYIEAQNKNNLTIHVMKGIECEINQYGDLDFPKSVLKRADYTIVGIHTNYDNSIKEATSRITKAIENPYTDILAHPSCRIFNSKPGFLFDMKYIIDACIANKVVIEINGNWKRLDLDPSYIDYAVNKGATFELAADAHSLTDYKKINNAIHIAVDKRIPQELIINTYNLDKIQSFFRNLHNLKH